MHKNQQIPSSDFMAFSSLIFPVAFIFFHLQLPRLASPATMYAELINPNANFSSLDYIDSNGAFLTSPNGTFRAGFFSSSARELTGFYLSVFHFSSNVVIWTANPTSPLPVSGSGMFFLTSDGFSLTGENGVTLWSTPPLNSPVAELQLAETGNLILLDKSNVSLWESFDYPTDTIVSGQRLPVGRSLVSASSDHDLTPGKHEFIVADQDAVLQWNGQTYWKLSMDINAFKNSNSPAKFLELNGTGLYLFGGDGSEIVIQVMLGTSGLKIAKLEPSGRFSIASFASNQRLLEFEAPVEDYQLPFVCGKLGFFVATGTSRSSPQGCYCPSGFRSSQLQSSDCSVLADEKSFLPSSCNLKTKSSINYIKLDSDLDYFANNFMENADPRISLLSCQELCSKNCSCLGIFFVRSSNSCILLENNLGSLMRSSEDSRNRVGYIKAIAESVKTADANGKKKFTTGLILFSLLGFVLFLVFTAFGVLWRRRYRGFAFARAKPRLGRRNSSFFTHELASIMSGPVRFDFEEIVAATDDFKNPIGSGGFGVVYKGTLRDNSVVAVEKITSSGAKGKEEFYAEIAILGSIHHINLVRLRGFCVHGSKRFLVFEYMNQGSLDRSLFGDHVPVLEWEERFNIALGTARGLEYLHGQCENKIIHFDIKPENILLHDDLRVKVSDFGLSRLLSSEESVLFTTMRGTIGYLAPEWLVNSGITDKTDVYSYGMVLLEIVRGERNWTLQTDRTSPGFFPLLALEMHEAGRYLELADPRLEGRVKAKEVRKLVLVALCCVQLHPMLRPSMANVVGMLEGRVPLSEPVVESLEFLRAFGRGFVDEATSEESDDHQQNRHVVQINALHNCNNLSALYSEQVSGPR